MIKSPQEKIRIVTEFINENIVFSETYRERYSLRQIVKLSNDFEIIELLEESNWFSNVFRMMMPETVHFENGRFIGLQPRKVLFDLECIELQVANFCRENLRETSYGVQISVGNIRDRIKGSEKWDISNRRLKTIIDECVPVRYHRKGYYTNLAFNDGKPIYEDIRSKVAETFEIVDIEQRLKMEVAFDYFLRQYEDFISPFIFGKFFRLALTEVFPNRSIYYNGKYRGIRFKTDETDKKPIEDISEVFKIFDERVKVFNANNGVTSFSRICSLLNKTHNIQDPEIIRLFKQWGSTQPNKPRIIDGNFRNLMILDKP